MNPGQGFVAVSFDPVDHGERRKGSKEQFQTKLRENKRRYFWLIMAHIAEEYPRIVDWALGGFGIHGNVLAGGVSMGGDISVVAAGIDRRIQAVAACISTPDWLRPGTDEKPSSPDVYAINCYLRCNPITNLPSYEHVPAICYLNGSEDAHVPPDGARRFRRALEEVYASSPARFEIIEYIGTGHRMTEQMLDDVVRWFQRWGYNR